MSGETSAGYSQPTLCSANVDTYDKVTHKIDDNAITVTLMKDKRRLERVDKEPKPTGVPIDVHCFDRKGKKDALLLPLLLLYVPIRSHAYARAHYT